MSEILKVCEQDRCGNCPVPSAYGYVAVQMHTLEVESLPDGGVAVSSRHSEDIEEALFAAAHGQRAISTIKGNGCYYLNSDGNLRKPKDQ